MSLWTSLLLNFKTFLFFLNTRVTTNQQTSQESIKYTIKSVTYWNREFRHTFGLVKNSTVQGFHRERNYEYSIDWKGNFHLIAARTSNMVTWVFHCLKLIKGRVRFYLISWVYTTNHKRIALNYFWFVIFAGICGMVLATIIRLEMAYPGVGILAGDSLQYLSVVTAHAVIMVFFMIMPLLFGAFGNFLLPTQLGVHDVAFPRLNSAAFWFLPAGLIMLCQLVCLDRRYQRMNCFNIREIQAILKGRFFHELINSEDHHDFLEKTSIGMRFKTNSLDSINPNMLLMFRYGPTSLSQGKSQVYSTTLIDSYTQREVFTPNAPIYTTINYIQKLLYFDYFIPAYGWFMNFEEFIDRGTAVYSCNQYGRSSFVTIGISSAYFFENECARWVNNFLHFFNLNEPFWLFINHYWGFHRVFIFNLMAGLMDNNMGHHKMRLYYRPKQIHPEIPVADDLHVIWTIFYCYYSVASRTVLINLRAIKATFCIYFTRTSERIKLYWASPAWKPNHILTHDPRTNEYYADFLIARFFYNFFQICIELFQNTLQTCRNNFFSSKFSIKFGFELSEVQYPLGRLNAEFVIGLRGVNSTFWTYVTSHFNTQSTSTLSTDNVEFSYSSQSDDTYTIHENLLFMNQEVASNYRYQKFQHPIFIADYKAGNFFSKVDLERFPHLVSTCSELTRGMRQSAWFLSESFSELWSSHFNMYLMSFSKPATETTSNFSVNGSPTFGFFHFFQTLSSESSFINHRWLSINALDQKFYRIFNTSSMQQRISANWRQLKFTREAWRCKLLAARHQKTMYKRYLNEDGVLWAIERNARDVLPGWAMITPFSARTRFTAIGKVDIGLMGVFLVLNSSIVSSANFLVTYRYLSTLNNRKMRDARSFFTEGVMVASWMMIAANPMLAIGILMLLSDRHWQTSFFDYSGGGDTVLFQHMFWFFGHPEVYVIMIPAFGFNNTILSFYLRKRVSARASLLYSMYTIAFLGFFVWGHHMYMVGLAHTTRMLFSTLTVMISVPAATKLMHWCVTLVNSSFSVELPFIFTLLFIFFFVSGGISGMAVAHTGMDILFHDSFYVIGHFHVMFAGSAMFASFGAFYFYFSAIFGVKFSRIWGYLHCIYYLLGQLMTVIPMFWLGYGGMPRRVLDYPAALGGWHAITSAGHLLSVAGMLAFFIMIFDSLRQGRPAVRNSLGVSRFNTRINFYLYEIARIRVVQTKGWSTYRYNQIDSLSLNELNFVNNELLEVTLYSYVFVEKNL